ncbi:Serine/threonine-protein kinase PknB [Planctomycetes bacterium Poly30]|uniref:Serine/threonine-protein kinase PknB n=1 Tax=Saltatorellus ferox TaxID=2528018 RepID=A0A518EWB6_9BACT|nr:Serine/threonine-protein kinase PknB [Planctomycetes bacterium Poly30]
MTESDWARVKELFGDALELPAAERAAFLDGACAGDLALRAEVESLLGEVTDDQKGFLETPAAAIFDAPAPEVGATIGGYELRGVIGEGGMGRVFEATQEYPHRTVALKVLRPGYFSAGAERRFQWEVEALGRLNHAGIAAVHDAGVERTADGHSVSWFAMEKIEGRPLLVAADELGLDRDGRIRLLLRVADAVAHAHQRGVIHRDLKPDNILVDASGQPHVLDFGIARALDPVETSLTSAGEIVGTIAYMSPEQVLGEPDRVDARSDVYALGVLLFRLLTGHAPLELSGLSLPKVALRLSREDAARLSRFDRSLRGDIETVLAKALERDADRRYASVDAFASDLRRFLDREPISARPPTAWYQASKFAERHRGLVAGFGLGLVGLVLAVVGTSVGLVRSQRAERAAVIERDRARDANQFLERVLASADPELGSRGVRVVDLLHQASLELGVTERVRSGQSTDVEMPAGSARLDLEVLAGLHGTIGETYLRLGVLDYARAHLAEARRAFLESDGPGSEGAIESAASLAELWLQMEDIDRAEAFRREVGESVEAFGAEAPPWMQMRPLELDVLFYDATSDRENALAAARRCFEGWLRFLSPGEDSVEVARSRLANALMESGEYPAADELLREGIAAMKALDGDDHPRLLTQELTRAQIANTRTEWGKALEIVERLMPRALFVWGSDHADTLVIKATYASALSGLDRHAEAIDVLEDVLATSLRVFGDGHENTFVARNNLSVALMYEKRFERAEEILRESLESLDGERDPVRVLLCEISLAAALENLGRLEESLATYESAKSGLMELAGEGHPQTHVTLNNMAMLFIKLGRGEEAVETARRVLALSEEHQPGSRVNVFPFRSNLGRALQAAGDFEGAEEVLLEVERRLGEDGAATPTEIARVRELLVDLYVAWEKPEKAEAWGAK